jgi:membrane protein
VTTRLRLTDALRVVRRVVEGLRAHRASHAAAAVAFWFFLSVIPLLVVVGFLVGQVARTRGVDALLGPVLDVVPAGAEDVLRHELERLARGGAASLAPLGVAGYLWTASSGLHNLMEALENVAKSRRRDWWKKRCIALAWVALGLAAACALAWLLVRLEAGTRSHVATLSPRLHGPFERRLVRRIPTVFEKLVAASLLLGVGMAFLAGFYRFAVERPRGVRRRVWPGTFAAVGCWFAVSWAFGAYVASIGDYALYYGSLAAVAVLLVWLYLTSLVLILGAEVNTQLEARDPRRAPR